MNNVFDTSYKDLNKAQREAVDAIEGPVMVIAGPGTGKTTILTLRIANILQKTDTAPENILALTFTDAGAYNIRKKLLEIIGSASYKVNIHTFHGFAAKVIQDYPDYFERIIGSRIITEPEQIRIIKHILANKAIKLLRPYGDQDYYISPILREIQTLKREGVSPQKLKQSQKFDTRSAKDTPQKKEKSASAKVEEEKIQKQIAKNLELAFVYSQYEKTLEARKYYDYEDMLIELVKAMENNDNFKLILQETYQYILADEHQDANGTQNKILELLADFHDSPNLFIVGDDKQAIYRFQGASLENFLYFTKKYPQALVIDLEHNYRSHQGILDASHSLILKNPTIPGRDRKRLMSLQMGSAPIFITECSSVSEELELVARLAFNMIEKGTEPNDIAILYRDNKHAEPISKALKQYGVDHRIESDFNILNEPDIVKITILLRAIHDLSSSETLAKALFLEEMHANPAHVAEICSFASKEKISLYKMTDEYSDVKDAYAKLVAWKRESESLFFVDFLQKLIQETDMIESILRSPNSLERLNTLQTFFEQVSSVAKTERTFYLRDYISYISIAEENGLNMKRKYADHVDGVRLMTAHRAKGLEFRNVFIVHAVDGVWGNRSGRNLFNIPVIEHARNVGRIEDERRLFYVALTRARETVHVTYAVFDGEKELIQSQFLSEIDSRHIDFDKINKDNESIPALDIWSRPKVSRKLSIFDPNFVRNKFISQALSVTHLNNFLECAWKYFFVNLIRIPQSETKHQMYGTAIHAVLKNYFAFLREDRKMNMKQILSLFRHELEKQPLGKKDREESFEKGKRSLEGYFKAYGGLWNTNILTEYGIKTSLNDILILDGIQENSLSMDLKVPVLSEYSSVSEQKSLRVEDSFRNKKNDKREQQKVKLDLTGKLDKIEFLNDTDVVVVDYKTAKPKSRNEIEGKTKNADGNYKRQLIFYKLLLENEDPYNSVLKSKNRLLKMKYGEIDFIEPNEKGIYKKESFEVDELEVSGLKSQIAQMVNDVYSMDFAGKACGKKDCQYCKLGNLLSKDI